MQKIHLAGTDKVIDVAQLPERERKAIGVLNGLETAHVEDTRTPFAEAVMVGGPRREEILRHLRRAFDFTPDQATALLERWIWEEQD